MPSMPAPQTLGQDAEVRQDIAQAAATPIIAKHVLEKIKKLEEEIETLKNTQSEPEGSGEDE